MDAVLVRANEVEVDDVGQHLILVLEHHVELASWVRLPACRKVVSERPHRNIEIVRAAAQVLVDHPVADADPRDIVHSQAHERPISGLGQREELVKLHLFLAVPAPLGEQVCHPAKEIGWGQQLDSGPDEIDREGFRRGT